MDGVSSETIDRAIMTSAIMGALPLIAIAIVELTKIPMAQGFYRTTSRLWRALFGFALFVFWMFSIFFQAGLTMGNLTALAMEPVGHIAGTAASLISATATIGSVILAAIVGQLFDGTLLVMIVGVGTFTLLGIVSAHQLRRYERGNIHSDTKSLHYHPIKK